MLYGKRICEVRESCGMTQNMLAEKLGLSRKTIGLYEAGMSRKPLTSLAAWEKLAEAFSTPDRKVVQPDGAAFLVNLYESEIAEKHLFLADVKRWKHRLSEQSFIIACHVVGISVHVNRNHVDHWQPSKW